MERVCFSFFKHKDNWPSVNKTSQVHLVIGGSFLECWYFNLGKSVTFEDTCQGHIHVYVLAGGELRWDILLRKCLLSKIT